MIKLTPDWKKAMDVFFLEAVQRRIIVAAQVILVLLLAMTLADLTWKVIPLQGIGLSISDNAPPVKMVTPLQGREGAKAGWDLAQWHLFGLKPAGVAMTAVESLPETNLNLTLRGVVAASGVSGGGAIIASPDGVEAFYVINAQLPGGASLKEVYPDRVVLERSGRLETLRLPRESLGGVGGLRDTGLPAVGAPSNIPSPEADSDLPAPSLREYRDMVLTDPQSAAGLVQITPKSAGGRFIGYEVQPGRDAELLSRIGLAAGDVVTSVNGMKLDSPAKALSLLRSMSDAEELTVEIERNGTPESLVIDINE